MNGVKVIQEMAKHELLKVIKQNMIAEGKKSTKKLTIPVPAKPEPT